MKKSTWLRSLSYFVSKLDRLPLNIIACSKEIVPENRKTIEINYISIESPLDHILKNTKLHT
jgi:hypothetical protein